MDVTAERAERAFKPETVKELREAPFYSLAYRLRTELGGEVWHWNEGGTWSEPEHAQGYWTSSATSEKPIMVSNGYKLPRRGNTKDQANHDGYSRLSDGDPESFWKSNPYLDAFYTGEDNALYPQWVLINFRKDVPIDGLRILWAEPYAIDYEVQYWEGGPAEYYKDMLRGRWRTFPKGQITGAGGRRCPASAERHSDQNELHSHPSQEGVGNCSGGLNGCSRQARLCHQRALCRRSRWQWRSRRCDDARRGWEEADRNRDLLDGPLASRDRSRPRYRTARHRSLDGVRPCAWKADPDAGRSSLRHARTMWQRRCVS